VDEVSDRVGAYVQEPGYLAFGGTNWHGVLVLVVALPPKIAGDAGLVSCGRRRLRPIETTTRQNRYPDAPDEVRETSFADDVRKLVSRLPLDQSQFVRS
jgi:hypothetical protein